VSFLRTDVALDRFEYWRKSFPSFLLCFD
jgi:hypothetical protein